MNSDLSLTTLAGTKLHIKKLTNVRSITGKIYVTIISNYLRLSNEFSIRILMLSRIPGGTPTLKGRVWYWENLNLTPKVDESSVVKFYF